MIKRTRAAVRTRLLLLFGPDENGREAFINQTTKLHPDTPIYTVTQVEQLLWALSFSHSDLVGAVNTVIIIVKSALDLTWQKNIETYSPSQVVDFHFFGTPNFQGFKPEGTWSHYPPTQIRSRNAENNDR